jgi:hypothetical protein
MVNPPSIIKLPPKLAVTVAINIVNTISAAAGFVKSPAIKKKPPAVSELLARNAITTGAGKCSSSPNHFLKNILSSGELIMPITEE